MYFIVYKNARTGRRVLNRRWDWNRQRGFAAGTGRMDRQRTLKEKWLFYPHCASISGEFGHGGPN